MTSSDWDPFWYPPGYKGCLCDDICANISPALFKKYSVPNNKKIFERFGYGSMHNCGPHPCLKEYFLYDKNNLKSVNLSLFFSTKDMEGFFQFLEGSKTIITLSFVIEELQWGIEKIINIYRQTVEKAVKFNIVVIPSFFPIDLSNTFC